jgi:hypothetical protein
VHCVTTIVVISIEGDIKMCSVASEIPERSSASDLIGKSTFLHGSNWARLHESIGVLDIGSILFTSESASKVGIVSEEVLMVLSPFEINVEQNYLLFIHIGEFSRLLFHSWFSVVVD